MRTIATRIKVSAATLALVGMAAAYCSKAPNSTAHAQVDSVSTVLNINSFGPLAIAADETIHIGLLLPAVRNLSQPAHLELFNSKGAMLVDTPVAMGEGGPIGAQYRIEILDGSLRLLDSMGNVLVSSRTSDNTVTGLLLPAVMQGTKQVGPLAASVQRFGADGTPMEFASFANGMVRM